MFAKYSNLSKPLVIATLALQVSVSLGSNVAEMTFFGDAIDYWKEGSSDPKHSAHSASPGTVRGIQDATPVHGGAEGNAQESFRSGEAFSWKKYSDPKNKEFFKEGDYTPPEPFMEIVRDPSDANLKNWFQYIGLKNELSTRLQTRMREYLAKNSANVPSEEREQIKRQVESFPKVAPDARRYRFRLYFDSHCPHCKRMLGTMAELQGLGYLVEARQVDQDSSALGSIPIPVERAESSEIHEKDIQSVPVLLVGDLSKKVVYRINGYQTTAQVLSALPKEDRR